MEILLGNLYNHGHLCRAVCCRLEHLDKLPELPPGFRLNHPQLAKVGGATRDPGINFQLERSFLIYKKKSLADTCRCPILRPRVPLFLILVMYRLFLKPECAAFFALWRQM